MKNLKFIFPVAFFIIGLMFFTSCNDTQPRETAFNNPVRKTKLTKNYYLIKESYLKDGKKVKIYRDNEGNEYYILVNEIPQDRIKNVN